MTTRGRGAHTAADEAVREGGADAPKGRAGHRADRAVAREGRDAKRGTAGAEREAGDGAPANVGAKRRGAGAKWANGGAKRADTRAKRTDGAAKRRDTRAKRTDDAAKRADTEAARMDAVGLAAVPHEKLAVFLRTVEALTNAHTLAEALDHVVRGFYDLGSVMVILLTQRDGALRYAGAHPREPMAALYRHIKGADLADLALPLSDSDNSYVRVYHTLEPLVLNGVEEAVRHVMETYAAPAETEPMLRAALTGQSGAVFPLEANGSVEGVVGVNYIGPVTADDARLFRLFARSAATMVRFKRDVIAREALAEEKRAVMVDLERALEEERRARQQLARAEGLAALGELSAIVAHEIRNPVAAIVNGLSTLRRLPTIDAQEALVLDVIAEETARMNRIVSDLLDFAAPARPDLEEASVGALAAAALAHAGQDAAMRPELATSLRVDPPGLSAYVDPHLLTQALVNLFVNALQAMPTGPGRLDVVAERIERAGTPWISLAVSDTGRGIASNERPHVFKPFFTTRARGTGLGLAIVRRNVEAHGGVVELDSGVGRGTTFRLLLPLAPTG